MKYFQISWIYFNLRQYLKPPIPLCKTEIFRKLTKTKSMLKYIYYIFYKYLTYRHLYNINESNIILVKNNIYSSFAFYLQIPCENSLWFFQHDQVFSSFGIIYFPQLLRPRDINAFPTFTTHFQEKHFL